ncbi:hypothetical protein B566_EDAN003940 [Ephemera danica]|nr:hypothetical protein B566_EDAN003940 [Ephemera danica]
MFCQRGAAVAAAVALLLVYHVSSSRAAPQRSKVAKRSREEGVLRQPLRPVYHSPPINAFSLKDLEPRDEDRALYTSATLKPQYQDTEYITGQDFRAGHLGEERYFGNQNGQGNSGFSGLNSGFDFGAGSTLDETTGHEFGGNQGFELGRLNLGGAKYSGQLYKAPKLLVPSYSKQQTQTFQKQQSYPQGAIQQKHLFDEWNHDDAKYEFSYQVIHHGDPHSYHKGSASSEPQFFGHAEKREGPVTRGRYHVLLPDGRHQNVAYLANHNGYHAQVSYNR